MKEFVKHWNWLTIILIILVIASCCFSCTENQRVKYWGSTATINLKENQRIISCSWKDEQLWYLYVEDSTIKPRTLYYHEKSNYGNVEGTYKFVEK